MGLLLIIAGIVLIAYSDYSAFMILGGIGLIIWGGSLLGKGAKKPATKPSGHGSGRSDSGGYDGPVHTGSGTPDHVYRSNGTYVNLYGSGWRETPNGRENIITGETVEKDIYGNWSYADGDGDTDDRANFGYDSDDD